MVLQFTRFFRVGHFWKYKPPGGCRGQIPGFVETQISATSRVLETVWLISPDGFLKFVSKVLFVALTFQGGSDEYGNEIYCM